MIVGSDQILDSDSAAAGAESEFIATGMHRTKAGKGVAGPGKVFDSLNPNLCIKAVPFLLQANDFSVGCNFPPEVFPAESGIIGLRHKKGKKTVGASGNGKRCDKLAAAANHGFPSILTILSLECC